MKIEETSLINLLLLTGKYILWVLCCYFKDILEFVLYFINKNFNKVLYETEEKNNNLNN